MPTYLEPLGLTQKAIANHLGCDIKVINRIVNGRTADMALKLAAASGSSPNHTPTSPLEATEERRTQQPTTTIRASICCPDIRTPQRNVTLHRIAPPPARATGARNRATSGGRGR